MNFACQATIAYLYDRIHETCIPKVRETANAWLGFFAGSTSVAVRAEIVPRAHRARRRWSWG
jgi:hypothetical protein